MSQRRRSPQVLTSREGVTPKGFRPADAVMWRLDRSAAYTAAAPVVSPRQLHQPASARELDRSLRRTMVPSAPLLQSEERTPWPSAAPLHTPRGDAAVDAAADAADGEAAAADTTAADAAADAGRSPSPPLPPRPAATAGSDDAAVAPWSGGDEADAEAAVAAEAAEAAAVAASVARLEVAPPPRRAAPSCSRVLVSVAAFTPDADEDARWVRLGLVIATEVAPPAAAEEEEGWQRLPQARRPEMRVERGGPRRIEVPLMSAGRMPSPPPHHALRHSPRAAPPPHDRPPSATPAAAGAAAGDALPPGKRRAAGAPPPETRPLAAVAFGVGQLAPVRTRADAPSAAQRTIRVHPHPLAASRRSPRKVVPFHQRVVDDGATAPLVSPRSAGAGAGWSARPRLA